MSEEQELHYWKAPNGKLHLSTSDNEETQTLCGEYMGKDPMKRKTERALSWDYVAYVYSSEVYVDCRKCEKVFLKHYAEES